MSDQEADALAGRLLGEDAVDLLIGGEDARVEDADTGEPLLIYRHNVLPPELLSAAWASLRDAATPTNNRGLATGKAESGAPDRTLRFAGVALGRHGGRRDFAR